MLQARAADAGPVRQSDGSERTPWSKTDIAGLAVLFVVATAMRVILLPTPGLREDLDQFVPWVHGLATLPFGEAYRMHVSFPPVMVYLWGVLAAAEPAFRVVTDASDPWTRVLMKTPASLADLALALCVVFVLRRRPTWAIGAAAAVLLVPAVLYDSAWWGQYESIYTLSGLAAIALAASGRDRAAAAILAVALMSKPQALPFAVPFAAWFLARHGLRGTAGLAAIGTSVIAVLWLPFLADGGPARYAENLAMYQGDIFNILSLRAWNFWWLLQETAGHGGFLTDGGAVMGPLTPRTIGLLVTGAFELVVFVSVLRRPTPRTLVLGAVASVLVAFAFLTTMHERYSYAALVFLVLLLDERPARWAWVVLAVVVSLNLAAAAPATAELRALVPISGPLGILGSFTMVTLAVLSVAATLGGLPSIRRRRETAPLAIEAT